MIVTYPFDFVSTIPLFTVAIEGFDDFHFTEPVVDFSSTDFPLRILLIEVKEILTALPDLTVILQVADFEPEVALILAEPLFFAVTTPFESTVATEVFELVHLTELAPVAVIANLFPTYIVSLVEESLIEPDGVVGAVGVVGVDGLEDELFLVA